VAVGAVVLAGLGVGGYLLIGSRTGAAGAGPVALIQTPVLSYDVPADWTQGGDPLTNPFGLDFTGVARGPEYSCGGRSFVRGIVASAVLPGTVALTSVPALTQGLAQALYTPPDGSRPDVTAGAARPIDVGGVQGSLVEATARTATDDGCLATAGTVLVLAVPTTGTDGKPAMAVLLVNGDDAGGPPDAPPSPSRATLDAIVASARPVTI
jgi:hypothetical protein